MTLDEFVSQAFDDHAKDAEAVFARLPDGVALVTDAAQLPSIAHVVAHVSGEHLGRWPEGIALLESLERLPVFDAASPNGKSVLRQKAVLQRCAGDVEASERSIAASAAGGDVPSASDRIRVLAIAASALAYQKRMDEARRDFEEAVALAAYGPTKEDPASRALAVTSHNIAVEFENKPELTDDERAMMLRCAEVSRRFWGIAGGPLEAERAEYRLSMSHLKAGDAAAGLRHAEECAKIVAENGLDAGETFFAHEAVARSRIDGGDVDGARPARDAMTALLPSIADESFRAFCAGELAKLEKALRRRREPRRPRATTSTAFKSPWK